MSDIDQRFEEYDASNPRVWELFRSYVHHLISSGHKRYSADAILHRIRWHHHVEIRSADFKINDHFSSRYARKFCREFPALADFFETRCLAGQRPRVVGAKPRHNAEVNALSA